MARSFEPTIAQEKQEEVHGLVLSKDTIRRLMIKARYWIPGKLAFNVWSVTHNPMTLCFVTFCTSEYNADVYQYTHHKAGFFIFSKR
ncbi:hypothetical protein DEO03_24560 [Escherichia coli]|nr:hypothetical protein DEO03_24560 [Escherichia coli]